MTHDYGKRLMVMSALADAQAPPVSEQLQTEERAQGQLLRQPSAASSLIAGLPCLRVRCNC